MIKNETITDGQLFTNKTVYLLAQFITVGLCASYLIWVIFNNEVPLDYGDGLLHFSISKASWVNSAEFLNHWGKPLYILFSSSFAQFGFEVYLLFNVLVFLATVFFLFKIFDHFNLKGIFPILTPVILLTVPDYTTCIVGGLTEPFFSLLLVIMLWAAVTEKWFVFALVASFTPYARSEGTLVLVTAPLLLILFKQWKALPLLLTASIIYLIAGKILIDQPLWYFENDPYSGKSIYGSGPWNTYLITFDRYLGYLPLYLSPLMIVGFLRWKQKELKKAALITIYFFGIFIAIVVVHSYLWAYGLKGALGLTRLGTQGVPALLGLGLVLAGLAVKERTKLISLIALVIIGWFSISQISALNLPIKATPFQQIIRKSQLYVAKNESNIGTIYFFHPLIAYHNGFTLMEQNAKYNFRYFDIQNDAVNLLKPGDIIIREAQFGPMEQGLPLNELEKYPWIKPVKHYFVDGDLRNLSNEPESVTIYQVFPKKDAKKQTIKTQTQAIDKKIKPINSVADEYVNIDENMKIPALKGYRQVLNVSYKLENTAETVYLIFKNNNGTSITVPLDPKLQNAQVFFGSGGKNGLLFIHNPSRKPYTLNMTLDSWDKYSDIGIQPLKK